MNKKSPMKFLIATIFCLAAISFAAGSTALDKGTDAPSDAPPVIERVESKRDINRIIDGYDYHAGITFNGVEWGIFVVHTPVTDWAKIMGDESEQEKARKRRKEWFDSTYRSERFGDANFSKWRDVFVRFLEWNKIAETNLPPPFEKRIAEFQEIGSDRFDFVWNGSRATLNGAYVDARETGLLVELMGHAEEIRSEWKSTKAKSEEAKVLFK